jgi:DNA-binding CsgD family transcriptional regulator/tetratricopeptide (TPR) repeat protein
VLVGRERECALVDDLLTAARDGHGGTLVLRGEAGIGKSALLSYAAERATGMRVLRGAGIESESEFPFAAVHQLLRPVPEHVEAIPARQKAALLAAFGLGQAVPADRFLISLAVLNVLAETAAVGPVLCLVDDAHWLDGASADALAFAARRIDAEGIVLLFATRDERFAAPGLPELTLIGLAPDEAGQLLTARATVSPEVQARLVADTMGNPLALAELAAALPADQLAGRTPLPDRLPAAGRLFDDRIQLLPTGTRTMLLVAAADGTGELRVVLGAAEVLGIGADALDLAEAAGLLMVDSPTVAFRHPLVRSAVYQSATFQQRQAVERALAEALDADADSDRRAWHLANAAIGTDEAAADALHRSAEGARRRGGHAAAATAFERAAALTAASELRAGRLADAAEAAWLAGQPHRARAALAAALPLAVAPQLRGRIDHLRGSLEMACGVPAAAYAILVGGADLVSTLNPTRAAGMLTEAGQIAWGTGDLPRLREAARRLTDLPSGEGRVALGGRVVTGLANFLDGDTAAATGQLREAADLARAVREPHALMLAAAGVMFLGDDARAIDLFTTAVAAARSAAAGSTLPSLLAPLATLEAWTGRYATATANATEGLRLAEETGQDNPAAHLRAVLAWLAAVRGQEKDCQEAAHATLTHAIGYRLGPHAAIANWALALLDLGTGRPVPAFDRLTTLTAAPGDSHPVIALFATADLVEAAAQTNEKQAAHTALTRLRTWAEHTTTPWARALVARCEGLLAQPDEQDRYFTTALDLHIQAARPYDTARTQLAFGKALRRRKQRAEARTHLRAAHETFARLNATPWTTQASTELQATGETARKRDPSTTTQLTPQELQIARFVADGATNRTIADHLFLSPRTVDYHLHKIFTKLNLSSRTELIKLSLDQLET